MPLATTTFKGSGHALGLAVGRRFTADIRASLNGDQCPTAAVADYHASAAGQGLYRRLLTLHRARQHALVGELEGLAEGAGVPFEQLFIANLLGEYRAHLGLSDAARCSSCALVSERHAVFGHNEDAPAGSRLDRSYFIRVEPGDAVPFTALCHPGLLPGAFGFNDHGLCFAVGDLCSGPTQQGIGRRFLARAMLAARTIDDAIACLRAQPRGAGMYCMLGSRAQRRIVCVEVSAQELQVRPIEGATFHASHYLYQDSAQPIDASSCARQLRGDALLAQQAPNDARAVLGVLRDPGETGSSPRWPIARDGLAPDNQATSFSALFDLERGTLRIYQGPQPTSDESGMHAGTPIAAAPIPGA